MLEIIKFEVSPFVQNCRALTCTATNYTVVVDPGDEADRIYTALKKKDRIPKQIWLTHSHIDHCGGVRKLIELSGATLVGHPGETFLRQNVVKIALMYGLPNGLVENCPEPEIKIIGGETLHIGEYNFKVSFTPGHSPGHVCFYESTEKVLLAGDTLFAGSIGRTDLPGGNTEQLLESINREIMSLPDETKVLSGHGPDTTVGIERATNPFLRD